MISNWEGTPYDLRRQGLSLVGAVSPFPVSDERAAALRELMLLAANHEPDRRRRRRLDDAYAQLETALQAVGH